jgi:hypothetical protein
MRNIVHKGYDRNANSSNMSAWSDNIGIRIL